MSTIQAANVVFESTANNRIQYAGSNTINIAVAGANTLIANSSQFILSPGGTTALTANTTRLSTNLRVDANTVYSNGTILTSSMESSENRIINGAFDFWQRGTSQTASGYGSADRWINDITGGTVTMSRQSFTVGDLLGKNCPKYFLRQAVSGHSLSSHLGRIGQKIEGVSSYAGQTITVLGWAKRNSGSGNICFEAQQNFGSGGSPSATVNTLGVTTISLTGSWAPFAVSFSVPSIAGKTLGTNNDDFLYVAFYTSAGSDYNARTNSLGFQTINVDLWGVHIRVGTHTTAACNEYIEPELGPELLRCQRYYEKSYAVDTNPGTVTDAGSCLVYIQPNTTLTGRYDVFNVDFKVEKRTAPNCTAYNPATGGTGTARAQNQAANLAVGVSEVGRTKLCGVLTNATVQSNDLIRLHWVADAEFY